MAHAAIVTDAMTQAFNRALAQLLNDRGFIVVDQQELRRDLSQALEMEVKDCASTVDDLVRAVVGRMRQQEQIRRSRVSSIFRGG